MMDHFLSHSAKSNVHLRGSATAAMFSGSMDESEWILQVLKGRKVGEPQLRAVGSGAGSDWQSHSSLSLSHLLFMMVCIDCMVYVKTVF